MSALPLESPPPMTFAERVLNYHRSLKPNWALPDGVELLFPYQAPETWAAMEAFYRKFYSDEHPRLFLFGINPGRFGAGVTGVPFTDPIRLESACGIANPFRKRPELSSVFVYEVVEALGGPSAFFGRCYITSLSPLGFVRDGKNLNYYDDSALLTAVEPHIENNLRTQAEFGMASRTVLCLGQGKNFTHFERLNQRLQLFERILPLPHPRWVMQYRRKRLSEFVDAYRRALEEALP